MSSRSILFRSDGKTSVIEREVASAFLEKDRKERQLWKLWKLFST